MESQIEAVRRLKEMGFFPTSVTVARQRGRGSAEPNRASGGLLRSSFRVPGLRARVKSRVVLTFTRQVATLLEAGMPLTRGLKLIQDQDCDPALRKVIGEVVASIEAG